MSTPPQSDLILRTKLYAPPGPADYVSRGRLIDMMDKALEVPLTLVSAPAGYGKSVLVSEWMRHQEHSSAWLSLDEADSDLWQFLTYLIAAIDTMSPGACRSTQELLVAPEPPSLPVVASYLINDLDNIDGTCFIVLDDYHFLVGSSLVHELVAKLLAHPSPHIHIVLITRRDPPLPLTSLRARNRLAEIRLRDLQFTEPETADLLAANMEHTIGADALANLQAEVEGWAAGLRLALLAVRHAKDPDAALKALHGGVPQTQMYLLSEVLAGLPAGVREYLLKSSILNRFCADVIGAICCPVTQSAPSELSGREFMDLVQRDNLFIWSLDSQRRWFRYHHLFQDLLQRQLQQESEAGDIEQLHARASAWFEGQHLIDEAILHASKAGGAFRAADIVERHYHKELNQDRFYVLEKWLGKLPAEFIQQRPKLLLGHAYVAFFRQQTTKLIPTLDQVESLLNNGAENGDLLIELQFFRGYNHFWEGNTEQSERELEAVVNAMPEEKQLLLAEAEVHLGLARYLNGKKAMALEALNYRIQNTGSTGSLLLPRLIGTMAIIHMLSGDLPRVRFEGRRMCESARSKQSMLNVSWGYYLGGLSRLHCMDLEGALDHFAAGSKHPYATDARAAVDALAGLALTQQLMQQPEAAAATVQRLIDFAYELNDPVQIDVARSCEARISLLNGNLAKAVDWANSARPQLDQLGLLLWLESPPITQARALIADGSTACLNKASELLQEIRDLSEECLFTCQIIEVAVLQCLLLERQGRRDTALVSLDEVVDMAARGGWVRPFVELGQPMAALLERFADQKGRTKFLRRVLDQSQVIQAQPASAAASEPQSGAAWSGEPLTKRELDILELVTQQLQNKEIATRLFVSPETVKTHLKNLYQKLGVSNRRDAAARSAEILFTTRSVARPSGRTETK